jgi:G3E family GTPase
MKEEHRSTAAATAVTVVAGGADAERLVAQLAWDIAAHEGPGSVAVVSETDPQPASSVATRVGVRWITAPAVEGTRQADCMSSASRLDLVTVMRLLIERPAPVRHVLVLVAPERSVATVAHTIIAEPELRRLVALDSVCAVVDGSTLSTRLALDLPFGSRPELEALAIADRIVVAGANRLTSAAWDRTARSVRTLNRLGPVWAPSIRAVGVGGFLGIEAWNGAPAIGPSNAAETLVVDDPDDLPTTIALECDSPLDAEACEDWFDELLARDGVRLLRLQGEVAVDGEDHLVWCRGIYDFATSEAAPRDQARPNHSRIVVVGHGLCARTVRQHFEDSIAR